MRILSIINIICLITLSCKEERSSTFKSIKTPFTKNIFSKDSFWHEIKKKYDRKLNLDNIESGVDSLEFRFWVDEQLSDDNLFIFRYEKDKMIAKNIFFIDTLYDEDFKKSISKSLKTKVEGTSFNMQHLISLNQKFSLSNIFNKYDLFNFPTQSSLKSYNGCCLDGVVYFFEIATKNFYKFVVYENPDCCMDKDIQNKIFLNFTEEFLSLLPEMESCWPRCSRKE